MDGKRNHDGTGAAEPELKRARLSEDEKEFDSIKDFLQKTSLLELIEDKKRHSSEHRRPIIMDHNQTVADGMETLARHHILSAPVVLAASTEDGDSGEYLGMLDTGSLFFHLVRDTLNEEDQSKSDSLHGKRLQELGSDFFKQLLITVVGEDNSMIYKGETSGSLWDLIKFAFLGCSPVRGSSQYPVHRVSIFDEKGRITSIISQSDVIRFLQSRPDVTRFLSSKSLAERGFLKKVITIDENKSTIEALQTMYEHSSLSAIGIVDSHGKLIANFSASDLRGIRPSDFALFDLPIIKFLTYKKEHDANASRDHAPHHVQHYHFEHYDYGKPHPKHSHDEENHHHHHIEDHHHAHPHHQLDPKASHDCHSHARIVSVNPKDNLASVLNLLVQFRLHRVYIVDEHHSPVGVVTLTDILRELIVHEN